MKPSLSFIPSGIPSGPARRRRACAPRFVDAALLLGLCASTALASPQLTVAPGAGVTTPSQSLFRSSKRITFEGLAVGAIVSEVYDVTGTGPVMVSAVNPRLPGANAAVVFDSSHPTSGDLDLGSPSADFGGPGVGSAGALGSSFANQRALGRVLIVAQDLVDANGDGLVDVPNDDEQRGTQINLDFSAIGTVDLVCMTFIDVEAQQPNAEVELFDRNGQSLGVHALPMAGDNGVAIVTFPDLERAQRVEVRLDGSGALDDVMFRGLNVGKIGDFVWCDTNDDGEADPGEPGLPGVRVDLRCAGNDGVLDTPDDYLDSTASDQDGRYQFMGLEPGLCRITVDPTTAPAGKVPGQCPTVVEIDLIPFGIYRKADFCFIAAPATVGDFVWCDTNDDGIQDPLEPGLAGVDVTLRCAGPDMLLGTADDILAVQATNANGAYLFTDVPPGTCRVTVNPATAPGGKVPGHHCPLSYTRSLAAGEAYLDADFCFISPGEVGDLVWCDLNNDGDYDLGEPRLADVAVDLRCAGPDGMLGTSDDIVRHTTTALDGSYLFTGIPAGLCEVTVDTNTAPAGKVPGVCPTQVTFTLPLTGSFLEADFCFITPGEVGDLVWCDDDNDGVFGPGEVGIPNVGVELRCAGGDGLLDTADDIVRTTLTQNDGTYLFENVLPDLCVVRVDVTSVPANKEPGVCPIQVVFTLAPAESFLDADFCFRFRPATIGDFVWCDVNDDGVAQLGEPGLEGVRVDLRCAGADGVLGTQDDLLDFRLTDHEGSYLFEEVPPGLCRVTVDSSTAPPSKVLGSCPPSLQIVLVPSAVFLDADFCFIDPPSGSIGDLVWCDRNDDGIRDVGEPGLPDVRVDLRCAGPDGILGTGDDLIDSRTTAHDGTYLFTSLPAGPCVVRVNPGTAPVGKVPGNHCPLSFQVTLAAGESFLDADFCFITPPASIGDRVFCDVDNDGVQGPNDPGLPGVRVDLRCAGNDQILGTVDDVLDTTVTGPGGAYLFTGLAAGECEVTVDPTTVGDKLPGLCPLDFRVVLQPGDEFLEADFCFVEPASLGDLVWCDVDNDGVRDPLEPGVSGLTVRILCAGPDQVLGTADDVGDQMVTNAQGAYLFTGLPPGPCAAELVQTTIPANKEIGLCPPALTVALAPGQSFLDADFCIRYGPPESCCNHGGVRTLTLLYTGESCGASVTTQEASKWSCSGNPGFASPVFVRSTDKANPFDLGGKIWFAGVVSLNSELILDAVVAGESKLKSNTYVHVFDSTGTTVLQTVNFHTSCSQPLATGQQYGSLRIVACTGENEPVPGDCCANGKPRVLTFVYTGASCAATSHAQDPSKVACSGDPAAAPSVFIRSSNNVDPNETNARIWFSGVVAIGAEFSLDAQLAGQNRLENNTYIHIFTPNGGTLLQTVKFHTSCSQPLFVGNQFGASLLVNCIGEHEPVPGNCCEEGKPRVLTFIYTGASCAATSHTQDPSKVACSGDPAFAATVFIRSSDNVNPTETNAHIWFSGVVDIGTEFSLDAQNAGLNRLENNTFIHIFAPNGGALLQTVKFHTSCSQPLFVGNQFGASLLVDCIGEHSPGPGGGNLCNQGRPAVLSLLYTGHDCSFTSHAQDPSKVSCGGDPAFASPVFVRASDKANPNDSGARVWFQGAVSLNQVVDLIASAAGESRLKTESFLHVFTTQGGTLLQSVRFHTSCSQPLRLGDQFGAFVVSGFVPD